MAKNLYVGNLAYEVTDEILRSHFEQIGPCDSAKVIVDKYSGRGKGFGFVEMASEEDAQEAIKKYHDTDFHGRKMIVNEAKPKKDHGSDFRGRGRY